MNMHQRKNQETNRSRVRRPGRGVKRDTPARHVEREGITEKWWTSYLAAMQW